MPTTQLKVTLPVQLQDFLRIKADKYGMTMSSYVRNLIVNDVKKSELPVKMASKAVLKAYQQAKKAEEKDELIKADDLDDFFEQL